MRDALVAVDAGALARDEEALRGCRRLGALCLVKSIELESSGSCGIPASRWPSAAPIRAWRVRGALPTNFSRVSMVPKILPQTSFDACILRAILSVQSCGTWQSGQVARTPERLVKWIVCFSSSKTLLCISWQLVQNFSVLVDFQRGVEAAPEHDAGDEAAEREEAEAEMRARAACELRQNRSSEDSSTLQSHRSAPPRAGRLISCHVLNVFGTSGWASVCWHVAGGAEVAARRHVGRAPGRRGP